MLNETENLWIIMDPQVILDHNISVIKCVGEYMANILSEDLCISNKRPHACFTAIMDLFTPRISLSASRAASGWLLYPLIQMKQSLSFKQGLTMSSCLGADLSTLLIPGQPSLEGPEGYTKAPGNLILGSSTF